MFSSTSSSARASSRRPLLARAAFTHSHSPTPSAPLTPPPHTLHALAPRNTQQDLLAARIRMAPEAMDDENINVEINARVGRDGVRPQRGQGSNLQLNWTGAPTTTPTQEAQEAQEETSREKEHRLRRANVVTSLGLRLGK